MIRRIEKGDIRVGMFIHGLEGSWLKHPFWRSQFLVESQEDVENIQASDVEAVLIDDARGAGPCRASVAPGLQAPAGPNTPIGPLVENKASRATKSRVSEARRNKPCAVSEELARAAKVIENSKAAVQRLFHDVRMGNAVVLTDVLKIVDDISSSVARNASALISMTRLRAKDEYTYMHSVAVCALMINLGRELGLEEAMTRDVGMAGLLHDVGKLEIPTEILNKPGRLADDEYLLIRTHTERGYEVLKSNGNVPDLALDVCLHHHEKVDGTGYPNRLSANEISLFAKMGAVCDVYDAMTSQRVYKEAWTPSESLSQMFQWSGHFDEEILQTFIRSVGIYPVGSLVRLKSNNLGVVTDHGAEQLTKPRVRIFCSASNPLSCSVRDVDLAASYDFIVSREDPASWGFVNYDAQWPLLIARGIAPKPMPLAG
jgi:putative nucleotidyltransferase with HDIG domain